MRWSSGAQIAFRSFSFKFGQDTNSGSLKIQIGRGGGSGGGGEGVVRCLDCLQKLKFQIWLGYEQWKSENSNRTRRQRFSVIIKPPKPGLGYGFWDFGIWFGLAWVWRNNGQLRFVRHHGWRTQAPLDQNFGLIVIGSEKTTTGSADRKSPLAQVQMHRVTTVFTLTFSIKRPFRSRHS